jgi:hypothetical protein
MNLRRILGVMALPCLLTSIKPASAATITNVTPPMSSTGLHQIDIFGNGFAPGGGHPATISVDFNGTVSTVNPNVVVADWHIQVTNVPPGASSGFIHVSINGGAAAPSPQRFIIISTNSYVTNFSPVYGNVGTPVTITGVHFQTAQATNVTFNGILGTSTFIKSDNEIDTVAPAGVTTGPIIVLAKGGAAHNFSTSSNQVSAATNFFAQANIIKFTPTNGSPGASVVVTGLNFTAASAVAIGSLNASDFTISNNTTLRFTIPTNATTDFITISPPAGTLLSPAQSALTFRILPTISNFSPTSGPVNTLITLNGSGLNERPGGPIISVGGGIVISFGTVLPDTVTFHVPATATSGPITVTTTNGSVTSAQIFYLPASIASFTPTIGAAGTIVTLTGNNFTNASLVTFNGITTTNFFVTNNTTLGVVAPAGVTSGIISITTPAGTTNSAGLFYVAPTITDFTPNHGLPGTRVMITGTSFTNASAVSFNGTPAASFIVTNNTTLSAVVSNNTTTGKISVTAPGGTAQSANDFIVDSGDLGIAAFDSPDPVFVGSNLVYTIIITNGGPVSAFNVRFTNTLPTSAVLKSASVTQGTLVTNTIPITGSLGTMVNQSILTVTLTVAPTVPGLITNTASIGADSIDPNTANNSSSVVTTVWPLPFLSITNLMTNDLVRISWPAPLSNFTLQFRTDLSADVVWSNDPAPKVLSGTNVTVIKTNDVGTPKFFRLTN